MNSLCRIIALVAAPCAAAPAVAQSPATPEAVSAALAAPAATAPVAFPVIIDGLVIQPGGGPGQANDPLDRNRSYRGGGDVVTLYVFRATQPNAALWFERAEAMLNLFAMPDGRVTPTPIVPVTSPGSPEPNGLARVYARPGGVGSTALAVLDINGWIVKIRSTSWTLDVAAQQVRMANAIAALKATGAVAKPRPVKLPEDCPAAPDGSSTAADRPPSKAITRPASKDVAAAKAALADHVRGVRGGEGSLAAAPDAYCRAAMANGGPLLALYERKGGGREGWVLLFADSGRSISGAPMEGPREARGMMVANSLDKSAIVLLATGVPEAASSWEAAIPVMMGRRRALAEASLDPADAPSPPQR